MSLRNRLLLTVVSVGLFSKPVQCDASTIAERRGHVRSRELANVFYTNALQTTSGQCRCEYPGENLYETSSSSSSSTSSSTTTTAATDYVMDGEVLIFPSHHEACAKVWFVCPGVDFTGIPWSYECPIEDETGERGRRRLQNLPQQQQQQQQQQHLHDRQLVDLSNGYDRPYYTAEGKSENEFPEEFHLLVDDTTKEYYMMLPESNEFCINGGTIILSGETPVGECAAKVLSFQKAGDRRPLPGGTSVGNDWFPTMGVRITASGDGGGNDNMHPTIVDMSDISANNHNGVLIPASVFTQLGGDSHTELGNVLVPMRMDGFHGDESDYGMITFEFSEKTTVRDLSVLNANDLSRLFIIHGDGSRSIQRLESVGVGGLQTVEVGLENVVQLSVVFKSIGAVVNMDLCVTRVYGD